MNTTMESLIAAALSTDASTRGNATYFSRFVFNGKYSLEFNSFNGEDIWVELVEIGDEGDTSNILVGHCLTMCHNEQLASIYAQFLWADFESLLYNNDSLSHIDKNDFEVALLNSRADDLTDRANHIVEEVFKTTEECEQYGNEVLCFVSDKYGPVYFNSDCLEYYVDALQFLPKDILQKVEAYTKDKLSFVRDMKNLSKLKGKTKKELKAHADKNKLILLDEILKTVDHDTFSWAINAYRDIEKALLNSSVVVE